MSKNPQKFASEQQHPELEPWQIWYAITSTLSISEVAKILKVSHETIYRWRSDGISSERHASQPENLHVILRRLCFYGRGDVARCVVQYLETAITPNVHPDAIVPLKKTVAEEFVSDFMKVAALQDAEESEASMEEIERRAQEAKDDIDRTVARIRKNRDSKKRNK